MKTKGILLTAALCTLGATMLFGQGNGQPQQPADAARTPGVQGQADPNKPAFVAKNCKNPPPAPAARGAAAGGPGGAPGAGAPGGGAAGGGRGAGGGAAAPPTDQPYTVTDIPGVIKAGSQWKSLWMTEGNNADGIVALDDGSLLLAQNDKSDVVQIDKNGNVTVPYTDTYTGGSLAANSKGQLFIGERALGLAIWQLRPTRKLFANMKDGEPLDCLQGAGIINDMSADNKGGVYMTMGGIYYANPQGVVMGRYGTVGGNGIILSPDGKTLYVTGRVNPNGARGAAPAPAAPAPGAAPAGRGGGGNNGGLVAFDVQPDGSLTNERQFADICGDGSTVDGAGRIYCTAARMADPNDPTKMLTGIGVVSPQGKVLGIIPTPRGVISVAFGGPDKKTLFTVAIRPVEVWSMQMEAQGYKGRPK